MLKRSFNLLYKNKILIIVVAILLVATTLGLYFKFRPKKVVTMDGSSVVTFSTDTPDEQKPSDDYVWQGGASDPKRIIIPDLNIDSYIQNVGVDQNSQVAVPNNIHFAGWFVDSVRPGNKGLSVIDGHLNGRQNDGIFVNLEKINKDANYTIEFGDGSVKKFRVVDIKVVDTDESASVLFSQNTSILNQVNLITCGGDFNQQDRLYDKRVIVQSELIN